MVYIL